MEQTDFVFIEGAPPPQTPPCRPLASIDNIGIIAGTEGNIIIDNVNNPQRITVNGPDRVFREEIHVPQQVTGYEYQFLACRDAIAEGLCEPPQMPLDETLYIMQLMDGLRKEWDVRYPMDED